MYLKSNEHLNNLANARKAGLDKIKCGFCNNFFTKAGVHRHEKCCAENPLNSSKWSNFPVCNVRFFQRHTRRTLTCSISCSNRLNPKVTRVTAPRSIMFKSTKKKCAVCSECRIVEVHHLDGNNVNNDINNLVPLCPTHHKYWHSRHRSLIEKDVLLWVKNNR